MLTKKFFEQSYAHFYSIDFTTFKPLIHTYTHFCAQLNHITYVYVNKNVTKMCITLKNIIK